MNKTNEEWAEEVKDLHNQIEELILEAKGLNNQIDELEAQLEREKETAQERGDTITDLQEKINQYENLVGEFVSDFKRI